MEIFKRSKDNIAFIKLFVSFKRFIDDTSLYRVSKPTVYFY